MGKYSSFMLKNILILLFNKGDIIIPFVRTTMELLIIYVFEKYYQVTLKHF